MSEGTIAQVLAGQATWAVSCGDSIAASMELPAECIDAVVTDPPYASGARTEASKSARAGGMVRGAKWNQRPIDTDQMATLGFVWLVRTVAIACRAALVDGGAFFSFIDWRQWPNLAGAVEAANFRVNKMVVWDKVSFGMGNGFRNQHELILFASKGVPKIVNADTADVLRFKRDENTFHPSPKPVPLMEALLRVCVPPGGVVLDPFAGSGSTMVAALRLGYRAIGFELDPKHVDTIRERCAAEETGSTIEAVRGGQGALFGRSA